MKRKYKNLYLICTTVMIVILTSNIRHYSKRPIKKYVLINSASNIMHSTFAGMNYNNITVLQNTMRDKIHKMKEDTSKLALCPLDFSCHPVTGKIRNDTDFKLYDFDTLSKRHSSVSEGGVWQPSGCKPRASIAVIVPYHDREQHLKIFINNMIPLLQKQKLAFRIILVEQQNSTALFNRAMLLNIGYIHALKMGHDSCFILHDVDYVAENWCNFYVCEEQPRHLCVISNKYNYRLFYHKFIGGGVAVSNKTMTNTHGLSNIYYGWGSEDNDFYGRLIRKGYVIRRYNNNIARYRALSHGLDKRNPHAEKHEPPSDGKYQTVDGFTTMNYTLVSIRLQPLFTNITVTFGGPTNSTEATKAFTLNTNKLNALLARKTLATKKST